MRYLRKIIRITGRDSPNVQLALAEQAGGRAPSGRNVVPGVLSWEEYRKRLALWDEVRICVGINGQFYEGAATLLFPPAWLDRAERLAEELQGQPRRAWSMGIDPGEGMSRTAWAVVDERGLIDLISLPTPDTAVVTGRTLGLMREHGIAPERVLFDRGGGGKEHADRLRAQGYPVQTVAFGEAVVPAPHRGQTPLADRVGHREERYAYRNMRAALYGRLRERLDPVGNPAGFALPARFTELRRQLGPIPLLYDGEGRLELLPKTRRDPNGTQPSLTSLLGCSPDEADAVCLALHGLAAPARRVAGRAF